MVSTDLLINLLDYSNFLILLKCYDMVREKGNAKSERKVRYY